MRVLDLILGALSLLEVASRLTKNTADDKLSVELQEGVRLLQGVLSKPVYKAQLEKIPAPFGT